MLNRTSFVTIFLLLIFSIPADGGIPLEEIKTHLDQVIEVLRDPALAGESGKNAEVEKIKTLSESLFDFEELSKRSLSQNWKRFSEAQQKEFVSLYKSLLQNTYSDRIASYTDEKILFGKETTLSEKTVEVQTTLETKSNDIPINYRLIQNNGKWKVYDVVIEGVSLINNYRTQFREILRNNPPETLLETLRKKVSDK